MYYYTSNDRQKNVSYFILVTTFSKSTTLNTSSDSHKKHHISLLATPISKISVFPALKPTTKIYEQYLEKQKTNHYYTYVYILKALFWFVIVLWSFIPNYTRDPLNFLYLKFKMDFLKWKRILKLSFQL